MLLSCDWLGIVNQGAELRVSGPSVICTYRKYLDHHSSKILTLTISLQGSWKLTHSNRHCNDLYNHWWPLRTYSVETACEELTSITPREMHIRKAAYARRGGGHRISAPHVKVKPCWQFLLFANCTTPKAENTRSTPRLALLRDGNLDWEYRVHIFEKREGVVVCILQSSASQGSTPVEYTTTTTINGTSGVCCIKSEELDSAVCFVETAFSCRVLWKA
jgi:hypothetical protein